LVYLHTGDEFIITGPGKANIAKEKIVAAQVKKTSGNPLLAEGNIKLNEFNQEGMLSRSGNQFTPAVKLVSPNASKILSPHPILVWESLGNGYLYRIEVLSEEQDSLYIAKTQSNSMHIPQAIKLPKEELLSWEIEASLGSENLYSSAVFFITGEKERQLIEKQRPAENAPFSRVLLFAWLMENKGLNHEAKKYWQILAKKRPDDPVIAAKLK